MLRPSGSGRRGVFLASHPAGAGRPGLKGENDAAWHSVGIQVVEGNLQVSAATMLLTSFGILDWCPHIASGKVVLVIATFLGLVFGLDDLLGPVRTNALAASWLAASSSFFRLLARLARESAALLWVLIIVSIATLAETALLVVSCSLYFLSANSAYEWKAVVAILALMSAIGVAAAVGYSLRSFLESPKVAEFLKSHSGYLEIRVMAKIAAAIAWAVEETERDSFRQTPTGLSPTPYDIRMPLPTILGLASLAATVTLVLSLMTRGAWFLSGGILWLLIFAPALALDALAKRTGAENFIKVGKYVVLAIMSIYGVLHD